MKFADFLNEAPLPDNWEKVKFNNGTFKSMIEYATAMSEKVGSGSSRVAFKIPYKGRDTVLKVAKNKKGVDNQSFFNAEKLTAYENKEQKICAYILFLILLPSTLRSLTKRLYCEM